MRSNLDSLQYVINCELYCRGEIWLHLVFSRIHDLVEETKKFAVHVLAKNQVTKVIYYIKLQLPSGSVCLSVGLPSFCQHDHRIATKFGTHMWIDLGKVRT